MPKIKKMTKVLKEKTTRVKRMIKKRVTKIRKQLKIRKRRKMVNIIVSQKIIKKLLRSQKKLQ